MKAILKSALAVTGLALAAQAMAQVTFYEHEDFRGRSYSTTRQINNLNRFGFNDRASSAIVTAERWEVCEHPGFSGRCVVLRRGNYPSLGSMGLDDAVSSVRSVSRHVNVDEDRYGPPPVSIYDARRRNGERLFEADVVAVRAVMGEPEQRCWVEREHVEQRGEANVPGAIAGAVIGGILGHQVGGGRGRDIATAGGVIAGGAIGANINRNGEVVAQDVRRCRDVPSSAKPAYYDVTYEFRGREHHVQMASAPGATVTVNRLGEPRIG